MSRPSRWAAGRRQPTLTAETRNSTRIVASHVGLGNCLQCGQRIKMMGDVTTCLSCRAWRRWGERSKQ